MLPRPKDTTEQPLPFIDLESQQTQIRPAIDNAIKRVLDEGHYIMGPQVFELEKELAQFCGAQHTLSCANGTDALALVLMAKNVTKGDAIFIPTFTFAATAEVVAWTEATAIFVDVLPDTFNMDPKSLLQGIDQAKKLGLTPRGIIPVDLFGQPADYDEILSIAKTYNLWTLADAAQSFGASYKGKHVGTFGLATSTSFFPAKPLGCYGDGGAVFTDDEKLLDIMKSLRVHGQGVDKYENIRIGMNGRLDTLQAAILLEKLKVFGTELTARQKAADYYATRLGDLVTVPTLLPQTTSSWAQYTITLREGADRARIINEMKDDGVPTAVYYVKPLHQQIAYRHFPTATGQGLKVSEDLSQRVLSLPMSGYLTEAQQDRVISSFKRAHNK